MSAYQIITPIVCGIAMVYIWSLALRRKKAWWAVIVWTLFWAAIATIALFPSFIDLLKTLLGIQKRETAIIITLIGILFAIIFNLISRLEALEQRTTRLIRTIALRDAHLSEKKDKA